MTRKEIYSKIKAMNLADEICKTFGDNFTRVSSNKLEDFIAKKQNCCKKSVKKNVKKNIKKNEATASIKDIVIRIVSTLQGNKLIDNKDAKFILEPFE